MSERVDGNNNTEGSYGPGSNESKTYTPLPVKMCLGILATAAIAMGGPGLCDAATGHSRTEQVGDCKVTTRDGEDFRIGDLANYFGIIEGDKRSVEIYGIARATSHYEGIFRKTPVKTDYMVGAIRGEDPNTHTEYSSEFAIPMSAVWINIEDEDGGSPAITFSGFSRHGFGAPLEGRRTTETCSTDGSVKTSTYDTPVVNGGDFIEWLAVSGSRQTIVTLSQEKYDSVIKNRNKVPMPVETDK